MTHISGAPAAGAAAPPEWDMGTCLLLPAWGRGGAEFCWRRPRGVPIGGANDENPEKTTSCVGPASARAAVRWRTCYIFGLLEGGSTRRRDPLVLSGSCP